MSTADRGSYFAVDDEGFNLALQKEIEQLHIDSVQVLHGFANRVVSRMKSLVPVDKGVLETRIGAIPGEDERGPYVDVGVVLPAAMVPPGHTRPGEYEFWVEHGTSDTPPEPFARPALAQEAAVFGNGTNEGPRG